MSLNLLHLRYFYTVAREGSFTRAAGRLKIAQPALSKMIRQLEGSVDRELLIRSKKGITLTAFGQRAFEYCRTIYESADELERVLQIPEISAFDTVKIGTSDAVASRLLPSALKSLREKAPNLRPVIHTGTSKEICLSLERRALDFALLFYTPNISGRLQSTDLKGFRFHLVVDKKFKNNSEVLQSFIGSREVDDESSHRFPTLSKWRKINSAAQIQYSTNSLPAHLEMVKQGLGISVLPAFMLEKELKRGDLIDLLPNENLFFQLKLVTHRDYKSTNVHETLLTFLKRQPDVLR